MVDYQAIFDAVVADPGYQANLDWGEPRPGHPEGTVRAHIAELEKNLDALKAKISDEEYWKVRVLIHTHDTFKGEAARGVAILHPRSHASLARAFLAQHGADDDVLAMVQYHDEPFALWRQWAAKGDYNRQRFAALLAAIKDWDVFLAFLIIDGCTSGKDRDKLCWFFE